jgi:Flp pilus assembly protein TadD
VSTEPGPSQELIERLGALGYVGGSGAAETGTPGADPKDKIEEFRIVNSLIREALVAFHAKDPALSAAKLQQVLARGISSFEVHYYLARALVAQGQAAEAGRHFDAAASHAPTHAAAWEGAADCRLRLGDREGALSRLRRGAEALPRDARLSAKLGELLRDAGHVEEAITRLRAAVELDPSVASYWNVLGMTLGGRGQLAEAERAFREAWRLDGRNQHHAYNLGLILLRQGRAAEARPYFEQALALDPRFAPARARLAEMGKRAG